MKSFTLKEINEVVKGIVTGDTTHLISGAEQVKLAAENHITFISNKKYVSLWKDSKASVALIDQTLDIIPGENRALIRVKNVDLAIADLLELFAPDPPLFDEAIHPSAVIHKTASIGKDCKIGAGCYIGAGVKVHDNVILYPNVTILDKSSIGRDTIIWPGTVIRERCEIGAYCILHPNVSVGGDGFGYRPGADGKSIVKIPHIGTVIIGNAVEIGSGTCIDRGKFSATTIGDGTKIDNLVQVGHNSRIGRMCLIAGCCAIAGSVTVGDGVVIAGQVGLKEHITIGNGVKIGAKSGVTTDIPDGVTILGFPAVNYKETLKQWAVLKRYGWFKQRFGEMLEALENFQPDMLLLIDYPGF
ncbi:MAG: UDP-3-O-(3-hydroxymyristoyl)glucosamine N-acyltransferase, partial [Ferruginibacter sp.]|nr:UDP-3-O-(3-hydroxymyristoyl)glucosamine N-acyltransferase [Chitinophagaceae bacterium]